MGRNDKLMKAYVVYRLSSCLSTENYVNKSIKALHYKTLVYRERIWPQLCLFFHDPRLLNSLSLSN